MNFETIWDSLLNGDPGPTMTLVDGLVENDFAFAAGGFVRDLAERMLLADSEIEDKADRDRFVEAVQKVLRQATTDDTSYEDLIREAREG